MSVDPSVWYVIVHVPMFGITAATFFVVKPETSISGTSTMHETMPNVLR